MVFPEPTAVASRFRDAISRPDEEIDLAEAALLIAQHASKNLDVPRYLSRLDRGIVYLKLECFRAALGDFERYLHLAPLA